VQNAPRTQQNNQVLIYSLIGAAIVIALIFIVISLGGTQAKFSQDFFTNIEVEAFEGGYIMGSPDAPVTIVEFADYLCPACQNYKPDVDRFMEEYVATGKARWEFRLLPTAGGDTTSYAGNLAYCAAEEGKHWGYITEVMYELAQTGQLQRNAATAFADRMGIGVDKLLRCAQNATFVRDDVRFANSVGANSTPTVLYRLNEGNPVLVSDRTFRGLTTLVDSLSQ
jgi:protein-disulfide isomerase